LSLFARVSESKQLELELVQIYREFPRRREFHVTSHPSGGALRARGGEGTLGGGAWLREADAALPSGLHPWLPRPKSPLISSCQFPGAYPCWSQEWNRVICLGGPRCCAHKPWSILRDPLVRRCPQKFRCRAVSHTLFRGQRVPLERRGQITWSVPGYRDSLLETAQEAVTIALNSGQ